MTETEADSGRIPTNPFPRGNTLWKLRSRAGRRAKFATPDALWESCCAYFEWVENNPLRQEKVFFYRGKFTRATVNKMRAMTLCGLTIFLRINIRTWGKWKNRPDLGPIIERVESIIWEQKFTGAAAGLLNPKIIARELALKGKGRGGVNGSE